MTMALQDSTADVFQRLGIIIVASAVPSRMLLVVTVISVSKSGSFTPAVPSQCFVLIKHSELALVELQRQEDEAFRKPEEELLLLVEYNLGLTEISKQY